MPNSIAQLLNNGYLILLIMCFLRFSYVRCSEPGLLLLRYVRLTANCGYVLQCNMPPINMELCTSGKILLMLWLCKCVSRQKHILGITKARMEVHVPLNDCDAV